MNGAAVEALVNTLSTHKPALTTWTMLVAKHFTETVPDALAPSGEWTAITGTGTCLVTVSTLTGAVIETDGGFVSVTPHADSTALAAFSRPWP